MRKAMMLAAAVSVMAGSSAAMARSSVPRESSRVERREVQKPDLSRERAFDRVRDARCRAMRGACER